jgi:hypothetical protein
MSRKGRLGIMPVLGALAAALPAGCRSGVPSPMPTTPHYVGPGVSIETVSDRHVVVVQSPTPGWSIGLDRVNEQVGYREVLVTLRRPNPAFAYSQMIVEQRLGTPVNSDQPVRVLVRVLGYGQPEREGKYAEAARSQ